MTALFLMENRGYLRIFFEIGELRLLHENKQDKHFYQCKKYKIEEKEITNRNTIN